MSKLKHDLKSDIEELSGSTSHTSQKLKSDTVKIKPSESVECLSYNIVLLESEVKVSILTYFK